MPPTAMTTGHWTCPACRSAEVAYETTSGHRRCRSCGAETACSVFLSYARGDDEPFVARLYEDLTARGFRVWWDRRDMPARELTFLEEIGQAVATQDRLLLVVGPKAATSEYVVKEWRWAWEMERPVKCVLRLGDPNLVPEDLRLIDYTDARVDADYESVLATLVRQLAEPPAPLGAVHGLPSLPAHLLSQSDRLRSLKESVLADLARPVFVTGPAARTGIHGMGGIGKSVLANLLARDRGIRHAFPDGIVWVTAGQQPDLAAVLREVVKVLGGDAVFTSIEEGRSRLREMLATRAALVLLDDVWDEQVAAAFDVLGPRCRLVMTTRNASLITSLGGRQYRVELLGEPQALDLLAHWAEVLPPEALETIRECGRLPLAISICGAMVRDGGTWASLLEALREADMELHGNVLKSIKVSVGRLDPLQAERFLELAVFPQDETIPEAAVVRPGHNASEQSRRSIGTNTAVLTFCQVSVKNADRLPARRDRHYAVTY